MVERTRHVNINYTVKIYLFQVDRPVYSSLGLISFHCHVDMIALKKIFSVIIDANTLNTLRTLRNALTPFARLHLTRTIKEE